MTDDEFQDRPAAPTTGLGALTGRGAPAAPALSHAAPPQAAVGAATRPPATGHRPPGGAHAAAPSILSGMPSLAGMAGMASGLGATGPDVKALGVRYIAVRGVFPLAKQIENYKKFLHLPHSEAANLVEIVDFVLERQTATSNMENPWKDAKWTQVQLTRAKEILNECSSLDPYDPVPTALQDPVITMQLPERLLFTWGQAATHPKIKGWEMKQEDIEVENKLIDALTKAADDANVQEPAKERTRGLSNTQRDVKGLAKAAAGNSDMMSMMKQMYGKMGPSTGAAGPMGQHSGPSTKSNDAP